MSLRVHREEKRRKNAVLKKEHSISKIIKFMTIITLNETDR
jgi:hypothetical protein